jgi:hypothetical protein
MLLQNSRCNSIIAARRPVRFIRVSSELGRRSVGMAGMDKFGAYNRLLARSHSDDGLHIKPTYAHAATPLLAAALISNHIIIYFRVGWLCRLLRCCLEGNTYTWGTQSENKYESGCSAARGVISHQHIEFYYEWW